MKKFKNKLKTNYSLAQLKEIETKLNIRINYLDAKADNSLGKTIFTAYLAFITAAIAVLLRAADAETFMNIVLSVVIVFSILILFFFGTPIFQIKGKWRRDCYKLLVEEAITELEEKKLKIKTKSKRFLYKKKIN